MRILLTNDDGINARGLHSLINELNTIAEIYVVAPRSEQSEPTEMTYKVNGKTITLSITNLDVLSKDAVFQPEE